MFLCAPTDIPSEKVDPIVLEHNIYKQTSEIHHNPQYNEYIHTKTNKTSTLNPTKAPSNIKKQITPIAISEDRSQIEETPESQADKQMIAALQNAEALQYIHDNISTETDVTKYRNTNHTLCDSWYISKCFIGAHHKTGSVLMNWHLSQQGIKYYLDEYCTGKNDSKYHKQKPNSIHVTYHLTAGILKYYTSYLSLDRQHSVYGTLVHYVFINMIRNPVDTILSSYNYHIKAPEKWTQISLYDIPSLKTHFHESFEIRCSAKLFINLTKSMGLQSNVSIADLYANILSEHEGIYFEFRRYSECCWKEIHSSYEIMNRLINGDNHILHGYDTNLIHAKQFRLENFFVDYNRSCNEYLDVMGIIQDVDRNRLMNRFQEWKYDTQNAEKMKDYAHNKHVTIGKFDKESQIKLLLQKDVNLSTDSVEHIAVHRCILLKNRSIMLGYKWQHSSIC